jgi:hypothetical protein
MSDFAAVSAVEEKQQTFDVTDFEGIHSTKETH